jgi:hypothetical protein
VDPRNFTAAHLAIVANAEVIAIDQDPLGRQGVRLVPPVNASRAAQWRRERAARDAAAAALPLPADSPIAFRLPAAYEGKYRIVDPAFDAFAWAMDRWAGSEQAEVWASGGRAEVWVRQLAFGKWALLAFNNGLAAPAPITCDSACWSAMGWGATQAVPVRDVWTHTDNGTVTGSFTAYAVAPNATVMVVLG